MFLSPSIYICLYLPRYLTPVSIRLALLGL